MPENNQSTGTAVQSTDLKISQEILEKFPELIEMIKKSESMKHEERQYWVDVLPVMTEDQIKNLRTILKNEKKQLDEADRKYEEGIEKEREKSELDFDEAKYREKKQKRLEAEKAHEVEEKEHEEAILKELEGME